MERWSGYSVPYIDVQIQRKLKNPKPIHNPDLKFDELSSEAKVILTTPAPGLSRYGKPVYKVYRNTQCFPEVWEFICSKQGLEMFGMCQNREKYIVLTPKVIEGV